MTQPQVHDKPCKVRNASGGLLTINFPPEKRGMPRESMHLAHKEVSPRELTVRELNGREVRKYLMTKDLRKVVVRKAGPPSGRQAHSKEDAARIKAVKEGKKLPARKTETSTATSSSSGE